MMRHHPDKVLGCIIQLILVYGMYHLTVVAAEKLK